MSEFPELTYEAVCDALGFIPNDERDTWVAMAMAVKSEFGEDGFDLWDEWSQGYEKYNSKDARSVWKSVRPGGRVGIGSLVHEAKQNGFAFKKEEIDEEERARRRAQAEARSVARQKELEEEETRTAWWQGFVAEKAQQIHDLLGDTGKSTYLDAKQVRAFGLRFVQRSMVIVTDEDAKTIELIMGADEIRAFFMSDYKNNEAVTFLYVKPGVIAVPMRDIDGKLWNLQFIFSSGKKQFLKNSRKQGTFHLIVGDATKSLLLAEGYATGASLHMGLGGPVALSFDKGNLLPVAQALRGKYSHFPIEVAGDNDHATNGNPGKEKAEKAARAVCGIAVLPEFDEDQVKLSDWNDYHVAYGLEAMVDHYLAQQSVAKATLTLDDSSVVDELPPVNAYEGDSGAGKAAQGQAGWQDLLVYTKQGGLRPGVGNAQLILLNDDEWISALGYCDFSYRVMKHHAPMPDAQAGEWEDADTARVRVWMTHKYNMTPARQDVQDALIVVSQRARFHPVRDYLNSLKWDGVERLDNWLEYALGALGNKDYLAAAGRKFLIGAVARIMRPGCKMDNVLILEGQQGKGKSTIVRQLFGDWYSDAPLPLGDKDAYQNIQGVWGVELAELDSFNKAESTTAKMFFSQVRDRYRPSYGHTAQDFQRQCVFIGTTNQEEYLKDYTGNRRYWPVQCHEIDLTYMPELRDQLWAEAMHWWQQGMPWWVTEPDIELFTREQDSRLQMDPWHYPIEDFLRSNTFDYTTSDVILNEAVKKDHGHITRADQNRIAPIMRLLGWHKKRKLIPVVGNKKAQRHVYMRPDDWKLSAGKASPELPDD